MMRNWSGFLADIICCRFQLGKYKESDSSSTSSQILTQSLTDDSSFNNSPKVNLLQSGTWSEIQIKYFFTNFVFMMAIYTKAIYGSSTLPSWMKYSSYLLVLQYQTFLKLSINIHVGQTSFTTFLLISFWHFCCMICAIYKYIEL